MKKENVFALKMDKKLMKLNKNYFIGSVILKEISKTLRLKGHKMYYVVFKNGAKTKLHYHKAGQTLIATAGKGVLITYTRRGQSKDRLKIKKITKTPLQKGDVIYIPACMLHWHGCIDRRHNFSHIAINSMTSKHKQASTVWFESDFKTFAEKI
ncbi:MAG: cupin domain-containing protein [Nitrosopumilaceae archaeon]